MLKQIHKCQQIAICNYKMLLSVYVPANKCLHANTDIHVCISHTIRTIHMFNQRVADVLFSYTAGYNLLKEKTAYHVEQGCW